MSLSDAITKVNSAIKKADEVAKKLTTKTRKALPDKVFCGPGRSFPTHDCAHIRAAKVYLGRSKFSAATKKRIAACINRRAKALKCNVTKKANAVFEELSSFEKALMDTEEFKSTKELVDQSLENENMELDFDGCDDCE